MAFKRITQTGAEDYDADSLPWANVWRSRATDPETPRLVHFVKLYDTGIMVVTYQYKAYLHKGTQQHTDLVEALEVWTASGQKGYPLLCGLDKRGKPVLGIDDERSKSKWIHSENTYAQVNDEPIAETISRERENPLLTGWGVPGTEPASGDNAHSSLRQDVAGKASGRAKKGL